MDPTLEERQSDQPQKKQGPISRGIGYINNPRGISRMFSAGKVGSRVVLQAGRSLATILIAHPWILGFLVIIAVFIFTFVIVFAGGFGAVPGAPTTPTITPTPTPAL